MAASSVSRLLLYKQNASPPSCAVMMLADMLRLRMEYREPALLKLEHKTPEFKKINPIGLIPVLQDNDFIISDSHVILKYLIKKYGGEHLETMYPEDLKTRTLVDQALFYDATMLFPSLKNVALPVMLQKQGRATPKQIAAINEACDVAETYLQTRPFIASDHLTIADLSVGATATSMSAIMSLDVDKYPRMSEWLSRLEKEPCFQKVNSVGVQALSKILNKFWLKFDQNSS